MRSAHKVIISLTIGLGALFISSQPAHLPVFLLIVPFLVLFGLLATLIALLIDHEHSALTAKGLRRGAGVAALPLLLLILGSLGQLTVHDTLIILAFFAVVYFYMRRLSAPPA